MTARVQPGTRTRHEPAVLLAVVVVAVVASGAAPRVRGTWLLEVAPIALALPVLVLTYRHFRFTPLVYRWLTGAALMIALGAHYSYADAPPGEWLRAAFDLDRNPYDRLGHVVQGVVAALVLRELLARLWFRRPGWWPYVFVTLAALGVSGGFELVEALAADLTGRVGEVYLGTQGDPLDAEWDMVCAFGGAIAAQLLFAGTQDRQLAALP